MVDPQRRLPEPSAQCSSRGPELEDPVASILNDLDRAGTHRAERKLRAHLGHELLGDVEIPVHVLDVVQVLESL
jgi:hypothetical protein